MALTVRPGVTGVDDVKRSMDATAAAAEKAAQRETAAAEQAAQRESQAVEQEAGKAGVRV